ncbi:gonadotropin-releasing hormone 2 [Labeo rohita]|uniref:Progonadoliberin n=1 Tax=Labeo rohita TaxID=84645 RepID=A0A498NKL9_LABRO|nr:gonadotropin-releasing hormone 2 [Labeo rohita]
MGMLLCLSAQFASSQHWSHGWYPGGKREIDVYDTSEVSEEIKLCEAGKCSYLRPQGRNILKTILGLWSCNGRTDRYYVNEVVVHMLTRTHSHVNSECNTNAAEKVSS